MKLTDSLVLDARLAGELTERSLAGQIEYWARLGRATDLLLRGETILRLKQSGQARPLSECLATVDTGEGRERTRRYLEGRPYPHFEPAPGRPGLIVKIDEDGTQTIGRFVQRVFCPEPGPEATG